ncbi:MAG: DUF4479 domain-containing protein [Bacillaceae bacterium]|nr:DUF4479 domain-containing protein [Bacillaceae bacterium]
MQVYYNKQGIGDVLIIPLKEGNRYRLSHERYQDVVKIVDEESGSVAGYNIFNASNYFQIDEQGPIQLSSDLLDDIHQVFKKNGLEETIDVDLSPKFVVGSVVEKKPHENADKLSVCKVDVGEETPLQIVCGAPNVEAGQKVVVAKVGAIMPDGMEIKDAELRGVQSSGMICSAKELGLPDAPKEKGILVLDDHYEKGQPFEF